MTNKNAPTVLTVKELATRWRCTVKSIREAIHDGKLAAFKVGERHYRIAIAEVERIERERERGAA